MLKYKYWWHWAVIAVSILAAYSNVFQAGFMSWDDPEYILHNPDIQHISATTISAWFQSFYIGNYHPLTLFSYAIDFAVGNQDPFIYHLTNIVLHICNGLLLYSFIKKLTGNVWVALLTALLFGLHPVQTESVSWVAERKNVLYGFFFLVSLNIYSGYLIKPSGVKLLLLFLVGLAAMLSKAVAVTLPLTLFAVDVWMHRPFKNVKVWLEKLPLFMLALVIGMVAMRAQKEGSFLGVHKIHSPVETVVYAGYAYTQYIVNLLMPYRLSVLYPYPASLNFVHVLFSLIAIGMIILAVYAYKRQWSILAGSILFFTVNIAPVLQFVQFGEVLMADRYLYIAGIGVWFAASYYLISWLNKKQNNIAAIIGVSLAAICLFLTFSRNKIWLSEENFWQSVVDTFPNSSVAQNSIGGVYLNAGNYSDAMTHVDQAISLDADNYKAWYNKGVISLRQGNIREAVYALSKSISIHEYSKALFTRAMLYQQVNQPLKALYDIEKVLQEEPGNARAYFIKASAQDQLNNIPSAIENYTKAIELEPRESLYFLRRGLAYASQHQLGPAMSDLNNAISIRPDDASAYFWRGIMKKETGQSPCSDLQQAARMGYKDAQQALSQFCNQ